MFFLKKQEPVIISFNFYIKNLYSHLISNKIMSEDFCQLRRWDVLKSKLNNVKADQFDKALMEHSQARLLDVRTIEEYQASHLPDAESMDYFGDDFLERLDQMDIDGEYFVYCRSGRRSVRVCTLMVNSGFKNVFNLDGGLNAYESQVHG